MRPRQLVACLSLLPIPTSLAPSPPASSHPPSAYRLCYNASTICNCAVIGWSQKLTTLPLRHLPPFSYPSFPPSLPFPSLSLATHTFPPLLSPTQELISQHCKVRQCICEDCEAKHQLSLLSLLLSSLLLS